MKSEEWIDLTHPLHEDTLPYPNDPGYHIKKTYTIEKDRFQLFEVHSGMHVGTHLDSPSHFISGGKDVSQIPISKTIGDAMKITVSPKNGVIYTQDILNQINQLKVKHPKLLIETGHSTKFSTSPYFLDCPCFEATFADFIVSENIELIGVDLPTFQTEKGPKYLHDILLSKEVVLLENLTNMSVLDEDIYLISLPLKLVGLDGSFTRAIAKNK